ncbi:unnamed protein product [Parascedosporium putredinis]|uniref:Uncharacterized protein n=1 Tax=Parascedosporium putredinis TaxID=1442378 RepID=A0A9P1HCX6_9PEZI|nr:unnamed protein product [Parascedosporium putredinis]CAI8005136.1 unnamed protein product [Parascedosporium putredinis]
MPIINGQKMAWTTLSQASVAVSKRHAAEITRADELGVGDFSRTETAEATKPQGIDRPRQP